MQLLKEKLVNEVGVLEDDVIIILRNNGTAELCYRLLNEQEEELLIRENMQLGTAIMANLQDGQFIDSLYDSLDEMYGENLH